MKAPVSLMVLTSLSLNANSVAPSRSSFAGETLIPKCPGKAKCPLKIEHPANGEEFPLGCSICRNMQAN